MTTIGETKMKVSSARREPLCDESVQQGNTVEFVVKERLCTSCGICAGICPRRAINMDVDRFGVFIPVIDRQICNQCGLCVSVCPGRGFDYVHFSQKVFGGLPSNPALGFYRQAYAGHTSDEQVLELSQSGGFVSTLLLYCIEKQLLDGAVVTRWRGDRPLRPETYIARTRDEVLSAVGSKYNPVPAAEIAHTLLATSGRFAFVGTSCQIQGMRKAEEVLPRLAEKIGLYVGLHCLGVFTYHFHEYVLHKMGLSIQDVAGFRHRDKGWRGWPCDMRVTDTHGKVHDLDADRSRLWPRPYFTNWRCLLCFDKANEFCDVSCGDCRIPAEHERALETRGYDKRRGFSEIVVRTERAGKLVASAAADGHLILVPVAPEAITRSIAVAGKKLGLNTFCHVARLFRCGVPEYGVRFILPESGQRRRGSMLRAWTVACSTHYFLAFFLAQYGAFRWLLKRIPQRLLKYLTRSRERWMEWACHASEPSLRMECRKSK